MAPGATAAKYGSGGGAVYVAKPKITKVSCLRQCASRHRARGGSTVKITGRELAAVTQVTFLGSYGEADDLKVRVRAGSNSRLHARVPVGAIAGPLAASTAVDVTSKPSAPLAILPPPPPAPNTKLSPVPGPREAGAPLIQTGTSRTRAYVGAQRAVSFSYQVNAASNVAVEVQLLRAGEATPVKTWAPPPVAPGQPQTVSWSGTIGRASARPGRYSFHLTAKGANGAVARSAQASDFDRDAFDLYDNIFPIRGKHDFGGSGAVFGTGRAGHSHQGHDVFAKCGTPMVAARGGRVQFKQYHAAAGNYLVIDGAGTDVDYTYMHLAEPTPFARGDRVYTGQRIGAVGETGNARGCHLHFELWSGPGWYDGGKPFNPLPSLKAWDGWS